MCERATESELGEQRRELHDASGRELDAIKGFQPRVTGLAERVLIALRVCRAKDAGRRANMWSGDEPGANGCYLQ